MIETVLNLSPPAHAQIELHCGVCGSQFTNRWRRDGTPVYSHGVLRAKVFDRGMGCMVRRVQACRCAAGRRHESLEPATAWTWAANQRRNRLAARAGRRMTTAAGRERMLQTWPESRQVDYALRVAERKTAGVDQETAEREVYVEMGDATDAPIQRPWRANVPVKQEVLL